MLPDINLATNRYKHVGSSPSQTSISTLIVSPDISTYWREEVDHSSAWSDHPTPFVTTYDSSYGAKVSRDLGLTMDSHMQPSTSLEGSWRMDDRLFHHTRDSSSSKIDQIQVPQRDVIWDIQGSGIPSINRSVFGGGHLGHDQSFAGPNDESGGGGKEKEKERHGDKGAPLSTAVLAKVMDSSKGRDKILKCLQYSLKTYLYLLTIVAGIRPLSPWFRSNAKRVKIAISSLSLTRKCLLLLNPLHPLTDLLSPEPMSPRTLVSHLIDLFSALSDDIYCLSKLGLVGKRTGVVADRWANRFWLLTTIMGLYKLHLKTIPKIQNSPTPSSITSIASVESQRAKLSEARWTNRKLLADLVFVSYDVFELNWPVFEEPMKCFTGLLSGLISASKLYNAQWDASVGKG
ncbi:hypothetical protein I317_06763 [Kwoniella heveanensis CBS 569]|nr:hypothetical protein I317_06763 [Kwoniella heveanensis CBS 569]